MSGSPTCHPSLLPIWACPLGQAWRSSRGASCYLPGVQEVWAGSIWLPAPFAPHNTQHVWKAWLRWPVVQLPVRVSALTYTVSSPTFQSSSLILFLLSPSPAVWQPFSFSLRSGATDACSTQVFLSVSQSQGPFVSLSQTLSPWVSWPLCFS